MSPSGRGTKQGGDVTEPKDPELLVATGSI